MGGPLGPKWELALATMSAVDENVQRAVERVVTHRMACERLQTVIGFTHICRLPVQVHPNLRFGEKHQPRAMLKTTPAPSSRRTSNRKPLDPIPPRSMKGAGASAADSALGG